MPLRIERVAVEGATQDCLAPFCLPRPVVDEWARFAPPQVRTLLVARDGSRLAGVAITAARPLASYLKVAGLWVAPEDPAGGGTGGLISGATGNAGNAGNAGKAGKAGKAGEARADGTDGTDETVVAALVTAAEDLAAESGLVVVKREVRARWASPADTGTGYFGPSAGYTAVAAPEFGAPIPDPGPSVPSAWFKWRVRKSSAAVPYMRQTTDFTCGTASLSMLLARAGIVGGLSRQTELALWRQATTIEACDPFGLAVTASRQGLRPQVVASTRDTLFTEELGSEQERRLREFIQDGFRAEADAAGLAAVPRTFDVAELRAVVAAGGAAIVLVDTELVTGEKCPHWIVVHGLLTGDGQGGGLGGEWFLAHDPWTEWAQGESWVDAYEVPLTADALDRLAWTGAPRVRAMLTFAG